MGVNGDGRLLTAIAQAPPWAKQIGRERSHGIVSCCAPEPADLQLRSEHVPEFPQFCNVRYRTVRDLGHLLEYLAEGPMAQDRATQNVLLIEDDPAAAVTIRQALTHLSEGTFHVEWVRSCSEAVEQLSLRGQQGADGIAAVLTDLFLPDSRGIETFDRLFHAIPQIPILILSASQDEELAKLAVQRGAQEYLLKECLDVESLPKTLSNMIQRAANVEALFEEKERAQVTLNSIGDAVMSTDVSGRVTYLNAVAESMTGWSREEAAGHPISEVFHIVDASTREAASNPMALAIGQNKTVSLAPNCILIRRDGSEAAVEDSTSPIHDRHGRVTGAVMVFHDVSTTRALSVRMSHMAQHDALTDLPNRAVLKDRLTHSIAMAHRHGQQLAVLFLDLDSFKQVNDSLGHDVGDRLLRCVAQRLLACVRGSDTVSRVGGDEFVVLLSEIADAQDAAICARKMLLALSAPYHIDEHDVQLTASIGVGAYPNDGTDAETLMKHADFAMYHAKGVSGNNYQFFEAAMTARAKEHQSLENGLREALARQQFALHYQPIIDLETGAISGVEALIRWHHPHRGLVFPDSFVPIAEESGLIVAIGRWGMREACRQARTWQEAHLPPMRVSTNVSAVELRDKDFVARVRAILAETGLAPCNLELELTETFLMQDSKSVAAVLRALKGVGVQIALDDFGTGYSSLSHLRRFPVDALKIDRAFVRSLASNAEDAIIVGLIIDMGKRLRIRVVAEGVETPEQLASLRRLGCPLGQGDYFAQASDAAQFTRFLEDHAVCPDSSAIRMSPESFLEHPTVRSVSESKRGRRGRIPGLHR
jgi:diguanylate cyclase (GGDEF)-like protein/PAS domain S-box-containing protein